MARRPARHLLQLRGIADRAGDLGWPQPIGIDVYLETGAGGCTHKSEHVADGVSLPRAYVEDCPLRKSLCLDQAQIGVDDVLDVEELALGREIAHSKTRLLFAAL